MPAPRGQRLSPHLYLDRAKPGLIAIDASGRRFANEGASYHHFVTAMLDGAAGLPVYLICDAAFVRQYGQGVIALVTRRLGRFELPGYLITAPTVDALAGRLGIDAAALAIWPADAASSSGLRTDADGRVFGAGDQIIDGLHACGNDMAPIMHGSYSGPGAALGPAIVFSWRVATHAAAQ